MNQKITPFKKANLALDLCRYDGAVKHQDAHAASWIRLTASYIARPSFS